jgi:hypothetical protein
VLLDLCRSFFVDENECACNKRSECLDAQPKAALSTFSDFELRFSTAVKIDIVATLTASDISAFNSGYIH